MRPGHSQGCVQKSNSSQPVPKASKNDSSMQKKHYHFTSDKPKAQTGFVLTSDDCEMDDDKDGNQKELPCRALADLHNIPKGSGSVMPNSHIWVLGSEKSVTSQKMHSY